MGKGRTRLAAIRASFEDKLSQNTVARRASLGTFRYWQIENGEGADPSDDERKAIAAALQVKVTDIAWPTDHPKAQAS